MKRALATVAQQGKWGKLSRLANEIHTRLSLLVSYGRNEEIAYLFWSPRFPRMRDPRPLLQQVSNLQAGFKQTREAMRRVDAGVYGVEFRADDDLNIVDPQPGELSGWIVVAVGVVVIAGLAWALYERDESARAITSKFNALSGATDRMFCKEGSPDTCAEWKQWKHASGYGEQKSALDKALDSIGRAGAIGAKWGLIVGIPLAAYLVLGWLQKKKS